VLSKLHVLKENRLIEEGEGSIRVTNCGRIVASKIHEVLEACSATGLEFARAPPESDCRIPTFRLLDSKYDVFRSIFLSRLSMQVLLLLHHGTTNRSRIRELCGNRSSTLRPKLRRLLEDGLIVGKTTYSYFPGREKRSSPGATRFS